MSLDICVDEVIWARAASLRQREWSALLHDLLGARPLFEGRTGRLALACDGKTLWLKFASHGETTVDLTQLHETLEEYIDVIHKLMDESASPPRVEALDMAKKVIHDAGARKLGELLPELTRDLETRRRFFSLVVALARDTTKLTIAHRHH